MAFTNTFVVLSNVPYEVLDRRVSQPKDLLTSVFIRINVSVSKTLRVCVAVLQSNWGRNSSDSRSNRICNEAVVERPPWVGRWHKL